MLSEKLKNHTKHNHQELEKKLVAQMRSMRNINDYGKMLTFFYGFFGGLETEIDQHFNTSGLPDYLQRRKTSALFNDLESLGMKLPELAGDSDLPPITNHLQSLGALYVIEGSTLGGQIISKMVQQQLKLQDNNGLSFFNGYGDSTSQMWQIFKQAINQPIEIYQEDIVIESANNTFFKFSNWFDKQSLS